MSTALDALSLHAAPGVENRLAPVRFTVPMGDTDEFRLLKPKMRAKVTITLGLLQRVHELRQNGERDFVSRVNTLAAGYRHIKGLSGSRLLAKYYRFIESGCKWRTLVPNYKSRSKQPAEFVEFIKGIIEQNPKSATAALHKFRDEIWPSGADIPGYGTWMSWFASKFPTQDVPTVFPRIWPDGWHVDNLRKYGPSRAERKIFTQGIGAAHGNLPVINRDPSKLKPMQWIVIDDFQLDVMCVFRGDPARGLKPQTAYVGGLMAMCVGTRKHLARLFGPMVDRDVKQADGTIKTTRQSVKALDVQALLYTVFREHGLPDYDVTIICENAAAAIAPELELMLSTVFEGRIKVHRTSLIEHKTLTNGYVEKGGTPWEKGWIESDFNYLWNQLADLPGYKGSNERLNGPADLGDKLAYAAKFLAHDDKGKKLNLPPELVDELHLPFLNEEQLAQAFDFVLARAERRTKHRMRGFDTITEFRWHNPQLPAPEGIDRHAPNDFRALAHLTPAQQILMIPEERKECTLERWERLSVANPRSALNPGTLALFLLTPNKAAWRNHAVTFTRQKGEGYSYVDDDNLLADVPERTELLAYVDFTAPESAFVTHLDGRPVGVLKMLGKSHRGVDITDDAAMAEARERRAKIVNRVLSQVRNRPLHVAANEQLAVDRAHNDKVAAAWRAATTDMPVADKIGMARGEAAAEQAIRDQAEATVQREQKALARRVHARAAKITADDANDFLSNEEKPAAPAATGATGSTNEAGQGQSLADYI